MEVYRDGVTFNASSVSVKKTREGHAVEQFETDKGTVFFVTLKGSHWCAHGNTVADAIADALWKDPERRPTMDQLKQQIIAAGVSRKITLPEFRLLTGACATGCRLAMARAAVSASAMTAHDIRDKISHEWGTKLLRILGWE